MAFCHHLLLMVLTLLAVVASTSGASAASRPLTPAAAVAATQKKVDKRARSSGPAAAGGLSAGGGAGARTTLSTGVLTMPTPAGSTGATKDKWNWGQAMPGNCVASASADLPQRFAEPEWLGVYTGNSHAGPHPKTYASVSASMIPLACNPTAWAWARLSAAITTVVAQGFNYCHHHAPQWATPAHLRAKCEADDNESGAQAAKQGCVCNLAGLSSARKPYQGVDCSNFSAFLYNLAFGFYPTSAIGRQACGAEAPGKLLSGIGPSRAAELAPGDLLFITPRRDGHSLPLRVSHVIVWTGWQVDFSSSASGPLAYANLLPAVPPKQLEGVKACVASRRAAGKPVWVISDSTHAGPKLRIFCGWYVNAFSHARRIIDASSLLPQDDSSVAYFDSSSGDCMSKGALNYL